jgi:hypothetical protein
MAFDASKLDGPTRATILHTPRGATHLTNFGRSSPNHERPHWQRTLYALRGYHTQLLVRGLLSRYLFGWCRFACALWAGE